MAPYPSSQTGFSQHHLFTRLHGRERRSSLLSRFEHACGLAIVPALAASQDISFDSPPPPCPCSYDTTSPTLRRGTSLPNLLCVALDPATQISGNDDGSLHIPHSPAISPLPVKFLLENGEQMNHASIVLSNGAARYNVARSSSCGASPLQLLPVAQSDHGPYPSRHLPIIEVSRSLPSPSRLSCFVDLAEDALEYEDILSRTPPDRIPAYSHGAPPTPRVPKKSHEIRSAPLGKQKPLRLQFGDMEGCGSPETSCTSNTSAKIGTLGGATKNQHCCKFRDNDGGCRGAELRQPASDVGQPGALQTFVVIPSDHPQTPPDKVFNSFVRSSTPAAPKKLPKKLLVGSLSDRERLS